MPRSFLVHILFFFHHDYVMWHICNPARTQFAEPDKDTSRHFAEPDKDSSTHLAEPDKDTSTHFVEPDEDTSTHFAVLF
jgi:hypothetical protein